MKLLGIDYGRKRLGLATCGALNIACPNQTLTRKNLEKDIEELFSFIQEEEIEKIIVGLPKNMNDSLGEMAKEAEEFAQKLSEKTRLPFELWDERLTSQQAERSLLQGGLTREKRKKSRDQIAATFMLQSYVDCHK